MAFFPEARGPASIMPGRNALRMFTTPKTCVEADHR
jgi:hypothetical protein